MGYREMKKLVHFDELCNIFHNINILNILFIAIMWNKNHI
nr:MAG TPA: hypothetical protein [Caudoviricetes sp.]